ALLPDESMDSFTWLLTCLKKGNPTYEPGVIFSDSDPAIAAAISKTFVTAYYHLCVFHLGNNETISFNHNGQSISKTLFPEIIAVCEKYLTPHIIAEIKQQIQQALWYRCYLFDILQEHCTNDESELTDGCIEDNYDAQQMHINSILSNVSYDKIQEAWRVVRIVGSGNVHYIILLKDSSFLCTCTWPVSRGIVCRHYFAVLIESDMAIFHISLIIQRWYKDAYFNEPEDTFNNISAIRSHNNALNRPNSPSQLNQTILTNRFEQLNFIRKASGSKKPNKKFIQDRIRYGKSYGLLQTVLTLAMETETEEEVNKWCYQFIQQKKKLINTIASNLNDTALNQEQENDICSTPAQEQENSIHSVPVQEQENNIQVTNPKIISVKGRPSKRQKG
ncbi:18921_t:CDS:2, partial [Racocetra persica]